MSEQANQQPTNTQTPDKMPIMQPMYMMSGMFPGAQAMPPIFPGQMPGFQ